MAARARNIPWVSSTCKCAHFLPWRNMSPLPLALPRMAAEIRTNPPPPSFLLWLNIFSRHHLPWKYLPLCTAACYEIFCTFRTVSIALNFNPWCKNHWLTTIVNVLPLCLPPPSRLSDFPDIHCIERSWSVIDDTKCVVAVFSVSFGRKEDSATL